MTEKYIVLWAGTVCWAINVHNFYPTQGCERIIQWQKFSWQLQKDKLSPDFVQLEPCHCNVNNKRRDICMKETFNAFVGLSTLSKNVINIDFMVIWVLSKNMTVLTK